ncbi:MAG: hypothetical protein AAB538_03785, partial [Patescibacteria group bacterium]
MFELHAQPVSSFAAAGLLATATRDEGKEKTEATTKIRQRTASAIKCLCIREVDLVTSIYHIEHYEEVSI